MRRLATENTSASSRREAPPRTISITRTRKSPEKAFGIVVLLQTNQCHKASPDPRNPF
jgi:hypothetical protein